MPAHSKMAAPVAKKSKSKGKEIMVIDPKKLLEGEPEECEREKIKSVNSICAIHRVMRMIPLCTHQVGCIQCALEIETGSGVPGEPRLVSDHISHNMRKMPRDMIDVYEQAMNIYGLRKPKSFKAKTLEKCCSAVPADDPFYQLVRGVRRVPLPMMTLTQYQTQLAAGGHESDDDASSYAVLSDVSDADDDDEGSEPSPRKQAVLSPRKDEVDVEMARDFVYIKGEDRKLDNTCRLVVKTLIDYPRWEKFRRNRSSETYYYYQPDKGLAFLFRGLEFRCVPLREEMLNCDDPWSLAPDIKIDTNAVENAPLGQEQLSRQNSQQRGPEIYRHGRRRNFAPPAQRSPQRTLRETARLRTLSQQKNNRSPCKPQR